MKKMDEKDVVKSGKSSVSVNILSNIRISLDGKSTFFIIIGIMIVTLVVSDVELETLSNIIHLIRAFIGS